MFLKSRNMHLKNIFGDSSFFLSGFSFAMHSQITWQQGKGDANRKPSLPFPPNSQILKQPGDYCGELTLAHN